MGYLRYLYETCLIITALPVVGFIFLKSYILCAQTYSAGVEWFFGL